MGSSSLISVFASLSSNLHFTVPCKEKLSAILISVSKRSFTMDLPPAHSPSHRINIAALDRSGLYRTKCPSLNCLAMSITSRCSIGVQWLTFHPSWPTDGQLSSSYILLSYPASFSTTSSTMLNSTVATTWLHWTCHRTDKVERLDLQQWSKRPCWTIGWKLRSSLRSAKLSDYHPFMCSDQRSTQSTPLSDFL